MRLLARKFLVLNMLVGAMLFLGAANASAVGVFLTTDYTGGVAGVSDVVTVTVHLDMEGGNPGIQFLSVGVRFDAQVLTYEQGLSSTSTYLLYTAAVPRVSPATYLAPAAATCGSGLTQGCNLWPVPPGPGIEQVNIDFLEPGFNYAYGALTGIYGDVLATLVFHVADVGDGIGEINLLLDGLTGNVYVDAAGGTDGDLNFGSAGIAVITPEPSTALLVGLGLIGLGVAGRRRA